MAFSGLSFHGRHAGQDTMDLVIKEPSLTDRHVGSRMRMRRKMLGMSQELAKALGLTFQQVQKYEKGANRIGSSRLHQISLILQVPVEFFFEGLPKSSSVSRSDVRSLTERVRVEFRRATSGRSIHADRKCASAAPNCASHRGNCWLRGKFLRQFKEAILKSRCASSNPLAPARQSGPSTDVFQVQRLQRKGSKSCVPPFPFAHPAKV
jgi:transcriptional regulator with XRE-family HTH domain